MLPDATVCDCIWQRWRMVRRSFAPWVPVEDILQDACVGYIEAARARRLDSPLGYAYRILGNQVTMAIRAAQLDRRHEDLGAVMERPHRAPDPERQAIESQSRRNALAIVRRVDEVVWRCCVAGESRDETCAALGITETQYNLRKSRGKAMAAERYQRRFGN